MSEFEANESFYVDAGDGEFRPSELPRGPWSHDHQHAGPPAALIGRAIESCPDPREPEGDPGEQFEVGRITYEILAPIPLAPLEVRAMVVRPGRRVQMLEAELRCGGDLVVLARGWRLRRAEVEIPVGVASADAAGLPSLAGRPTGETGPPRPPGEVRSSPGFFPGAADVGYHTAIEYRFLSGAGFNAPGPATCWMRMAKPLVAGSEPTPLERTLVVADSGNGISATLDFETTTFINVDLSVHLNRMPVGEWVCLDSITVPEPTGVGISDTMLWDEQGPIGRAAQTLLISERS